MTKALEHDGRPAALLDRTAFYPTSGGQPFDIGRLAAIDVVETVDAGDEIVHVLSSPLAEGTTVRGEIDWDRRFDHMQQHTGQHVLSAAFDRLFENRTMSFHMGAEDGDDRSCARDVVGADRARRRRSQPRRLGRPRGVDPIRVGRGEAAALPLRKEPAREGTLRLIEVTDFDLVGVRRHARGADGGDRRDRRRRRGEVQGRHAHHVCVRRPRASRVQNAARVGGWQRAGALRCCPGSCRRPSSGCRRRRRISAGPSRNFRRRSQATKRARLMAEGGSSDGPTGGHVHVVVEALDGWDANGPQGDRVGDHRRHARGGGVVLDDVAIRGRHRQVGRRAHRCERHPARAHGAIRRPRRRKPDLRAGRRMSRRSRRDHAGRAKSAYFKSVIGGRKSSAKTVGTDRFAAETRRHVNCPLNVPQYELGAGDRAGFLPGGSAQFRGAREARRRARGRRRRPTPRSSR